MLDVARLLCPYPHVDEHGKFADGLAFAQPRICQKCKERDCWGHADRKGSVDVAHSVCPKGMSLVLCRFPAGVLLCNGLIVKAQNLQCPPAVRKKLKGQRVAWDEILAWQKNLAQVFPVLEDAAEKKAQEAIDGLHDVKTAVSLVTRNAEAIIGTLPGESDDEKIENAADPLKALLKSVELLRTRLSASSILANPEAASYGQKHPTPVHKVCLKMVRLFQELAAKRGIRMRMAGPSYAMPRCYDSFETIPLVLIDNAVKYSEENREIFVTVRDMAEFVTMEVESFGPLVPEPMRKAIFGRGTRGLGSQQFVSKGSGLGLFIASIVARAHGFEIKYQSVPSGTTASRGRNIFSCRIPLA